jgi:SAM-dependent methyltransferase
MPLEDNTLQGWRDLFGEKIKPELKKTGLCSSLCKQSDFGNNEYVYWCTQIKEEPRMHRKQWEFYFICQALYEAGVLKRGMKGLGFGVGREPLPAVFANIGCHIVATDMEESEAVIKGWKDTKQHASNVKVLNDRNICPDQIFKDLVSFRCVDMKAIPEDLVNFDFCWSACCMEHLGSIEKGLEFLKSSLKCLKPGGISVHTTEFNLSSENETIDNVGTVLFRKKDMDAISGELKNGGHIIKEINFDDGHDKLDKYYDVPPYRAEQHLKLAIDKFIATSIGLIIQKGGTA